MNRSLLPLVVVLVAAACTGRSPAPEATTTPAREIVLMTHDSFAASDEVLAAFEDETGARIAILEAGDAGTMLNQAILTKDDPIADVLYGIDNTFLGRGLAEGIFLPYESPLLADVDPTLLPTDVDPDHRVTPIDYGDVCINYDATFFTELDPPATLEDLVEPAYRDLLVVEDPATSSPGLAFLLATIARFPEDSGYPWTRYWEELVANGVEIAPDWEQAYYGRFSGGSGEGDRPLVVSYASSPVAEAYFGELDEPPTGVVVDGCFRQVEYAGILRGTRREDLARRLVDFLLSPTFQEDIPLNMFVFPANTEAGLPEVFVEHAVIPGSPLGLDPELIDARREEWIRTWTEIVR